MVSNAVCPIKCLIAIVSCYLSHRPADIGYLPLNNRIFPHLLLGKTISTRWLTIMKHHYSVYNPILRWLTFMYPWCLRHYCHESLTLKKSGPHTMMIFPLLPNFGARRSSGGHHVPKPMFADSFRYFLLGCIKTYIAIYIAYIMIYSGGWTSTRLLGVWLIPMFSWLVVWNMFFSIQLGIIITDELIHFFRGVGQPPSS